MDDAGKEGARFRGEGRREVDEWMEGRRKAAAYLLECLLVTRVNERFLIHLYKKAGCLGYLGCVECMVG